AETPAGASGGTPAGAGSGSGLPGSTPAAVVTPGADTLDQAAHLAESAEIEMPPFLGVRALNEVVPPLAMLLVVVLTSAGALATSGRRLPAAVTAVPGRFRRRLPRPRRPRRAGAR
ncbi:MAG TPA: hypothetical protein VFI47_27835, partial [Acidimicrobiales bacterium]|nr:hypothetical protein [Acidimicrobiales bacterium]